MRNTQQKMPTSKIIFIVTLLVAYTIGSWILRKATNTETYAILGGSLAMAIVYGFFKMKPAEKHNDHDERIQCIIKNAWRAAYFSVFGILALLSVYEDFVAETPLGMLHIFPFVLIGSGLVFLLYYHIKKNN